MFFLLHFVNGNHCNLPWKSTGTSTLHLYILVPFIRPWTKGYKWAQCKNSLIIPYVSFSFCFPSAVFRLFPLTKFSTKWQFQSRFFSLRDKYWANIDKNIAKNETKHRVSTSESMQWKSTFFVELLMQYRILLPSSDIT